MKLSRAEIRLAAESIACNVWEKGGSSDQAAIEIERAFRRDGERAQEAAQEYASSWYRSAALAEALPDALMEAQEEMGNGNQP